ncbi:hypothetical protein ACFWN2_01000 [Lentzea sp. NPDC058436]|uniref:hypothetical protein n=1 Tax=Lentzea sp. NPDC058436 TaxID=3346499 RepID=UPI00365332FF
MTAHTCRLTGYRRRAEEFHRGRWLVGDLVSFRDDRRVPLFHDEPPETRSVSRTLVSPGHAWVSFTGIDWIDRRARLEMRVLDAGPSDRLDALVAEAVEVAFGRFGLLRLEGWVTPGHYDVAPALLDNGFVMEAVVPHAIRVDGKPVDRQIWGKVGER